MKCPTCDQPTSIINGIRAGCMHLRTPRVVADCLFRPLCHFEMAVMSGYTVLLAQPLFSYRLMPLPSEEKLERAPDIGKG